MTLLVPLPRLVVLVSGHGSNFQAILDACASGELPAQVMAVVSNRTDAFALERARHARLPVVVFPQLAGQDRRSYDAELANQVAAYAPDWIVLAGWMRILSAAFLKHFPARVVNLHPALPGTFPGTHAIERAYAASRQSALSQTGVMVHLVPDEEVDNGPILAQASVPIYPADTLEQLEARIHATEHTLLIATLVALCNNMPADGQQRL